MAFECFRFDEGLLTEWTFIDETIMLPVIVSIKFLWSDALIAQLTLLHALRHKKTKNKM